MRGDVVALLDRSFPARGDAFWVPPRQLFVGDADVARAVLTNADGRYAEHSDFFHTRRGTFGPRAAQVKMGTDARALLQEHMAARAPALARAVDALAPLTDWPDAGNRLVYAHLAGALISEDAPESLRRLLEEVVTRAVLAGARERQSLLRRVWLRLRVAHALASEIERRRRRAGPPVDVLDAIVAATEPSAPRDELAEIFLSFLFATAGSVGFALAWSVYLLGTHDAADARPAWIVREALRLWPVAWQLARRPARPHDVLGHAVTPRDHVVVCPYLIHRNPKYWDEPDAFRPERWADGGHRRAFLPFGVGPHSCASAALSLQLVEQILALLLQRGSVFARARDARPHDGPALAPPSFTVALTRRRKSSVESIMGKEVNPR